MQDKKNKTLSALEEEKLLKEIRDRYDLSVGSDAYKENVASFIEDTEFENGKQWDEDVKDEREADGRPCLVINKTQQIVKQILGDAKQNKISIKVKPVDNKTDPKLAAIYNGQIRSIENQSQADNAYDTALGFSVRGGWGYIRALTEYSGPDTFDQDIKIERIINPLAVKDDPACKKLDRSDRRFLFLTDDVDLEEFKREYPNSQVTTGILAASSGDSERTWIGKDTVRVAEYFRIVEKKEKLYQLDDGVTIRASKITENGGEVIEVKAGVVVGEKKGSRLYPQHIYELPDDKYVFDGQDTAATITNERTTKIPSVEWYKTNGHEIIEGPKDIPCIHIPFAFIPGDEVWINGKQILRSAIKWSKDPNRLYNFARSSASETLGLAPIQPFIGTVKQFLGLEKIWDKINKKALPYAPYNTDPAAPGAPQRQQAAFPNMGADREAMVSSDDIKSTSGKYDASLGAAGNETSGKAINARQRQGDISTFVFIDNQMVGLNFLGRIVVDMIGKVIDSSRIVRLVGEDGKETWEEVNQVVNDPENPGKTKIVNDLSVAKFDITVSAGPAYATMRQEAIDGMVAMAQAFPQAGPVLAPMILKNSDWPGAQEAAETLSKLLGVPISGEEGDSEEGQPGMPPGGQGQPGPQQPPPDPNVQLDIEGKQLVNEKRRQDIAKSATNQEDRMKQLIVEALSDLNLIPQLAAQKQTTPDGG